MNMERIDCQNCVCLVVNKLGNWVCDEIDKEIQECLKKAIY